MQHAQCHAHLIIEGLLGSAARLRQLFHLLFGSVKPSLRHLHEQDAGGKQTTLSRLLKMLPLLFGSIKPSLLPPA